MFSHPSNIIRQCGISAGAVVGDFGAGEGAYAREAAKIVGPQGTVYALDVQRALVERLTKEVKDIPDNVIQPLWVDLEASRGTTLADDVLDLAILANLLFQIEDKPKLLREVVRVLRPGGRALIVDWKESFGHMGPHPDQVVSDRLARSLATDVGLIFDKEVDGGAHHYGLVFRKPV